MCCQTRRLVLCSFPCRAAQCDDFDCLGMIVGPTTNITTDRMSNIDIFLVWRGGLKTTKAC